jgi:cellulose biosynthesis protein BcsQ
MAKIISVFNNKGGVGKTILTWNIGDALARRGKKVLLVDFDPQCNLSLAVLGRVVKCRY